MYTYTFSKTDLAFKRVCVCVFMHIIFFYDCTVEQDFKASEILFVERFCGSLATFCVSSGQLV